MWGQVKHLTISKYFSLFHLLLSAKLANFTKAVIKSCRFTNVVINDYCLTSLLIASGTVIINRDSEYIILLPSESKPETFVKYFSISHIMIDNFASLY